LASCARQAPSTGRFRLSFMNLPWGLGNPCELAWGELGIRHGLKMALRHL